MKWERQREREKWRQWKITFLSVPNVIESNLISILAKQLNYVDGGGVICIALNYERARTNTEETK